ncbi:MAG: acetyltransferase [Thermoleophilia bacterium]|nr:acetyltransferase [Thermoleophilia bacterium]
MSTTDERPNLTVQRISATQTHPLRMAVLRPGAPKAECEFPGDEDELTFHAGAELDGRIVSIASLYLEPRPVDAAGGAPVAPDHGAGTAWRLRGMATEPGLRKCGAGRAALEACEAHAREHGATLAWCNARVEAVGFYERLGWTVLGEEFDIPTVGPHFVMERSLR